MTSELETLKTNEFLRRRKLRLQQVREQSKDIAKKLRQRAKVEKLRHESDSKKERDYLQHQEKLVKRLEYLYAQGVKSVGDSHKKASGVTHLGISPEKSDLSRVRGKEAVAELRKKRQEKLDEQKKLLDRKLLAREAANEISREKSSCVANKLLAKPSTTKLTEDTEQGATVVESNVEDNAEASKITKNDMATQWDFEEMPNEWEPNVPALSLPKDDKESLRDSNNVGESKSDKSKRLDLFALSAEMPSSLRGGVTNMPEEPPPFKPAMTIVSEYLQSRALRLRETDTAGSSKRQSDDLQNLKQTILRTRSSKIDGNLSCYNACCVLDEQIIPVPAWQAESNCEFCSHKVLHHKQSNICRQFTVTNSQINEIFSSIRPTSQEFNPSPVLRGSSPFRRSKVCPRYGKSSGKRITEKSTASSSADLVLRKKNSVTMYNHSTRDSRDVPCADSGVVVRDTKSDDDAYSQALREANIEEPKEKEHQKKLQEMRSKVAMTKQTVEKEYNDTMSFLKSLPEDKCSKHMKNSHMDERRQKILKVSRQQKLQHEFSKIEKECRRNCAQNAKARQTTPEKSRNNSKSPAKNDLDEDFDSRDLQYSWMPVPESDENLAIHTIPTTLKGGKSGNTVKFSQVDSYHEYRSRHKHTPPTKDTSHERPAKRVVETVLIHKDENDSTDCSSLSSDTSSVENLNLGLKAKKQQDQIMTEADRIIVYKILESKLNKSEKKKKKLKLIDDVAKVLNSMNKERSENTEHDKNNNEEEKLGNCNEKHVEVGLQKSVSIDQVKEGVYKVVNEKGENITSLYFSDNPQQNCKLLLTEDELNHDRPCCCSKKNKAEQQSEKGTSLHCGNGDITAKRNTTYQGCKCGRTVVSQPREEDKTSEMQASTASSTSSFKTAKNDKALGALPDGGYIKLIDDDGQEAGKFYIGASGFLRDDAYEVIIQLKKKEPARKKSETEHKSSQDNENIQKSTDERKEKNKLPPQNDQSSSSEKVMPDMQEVYVNEDIKDKESEKILSRPNSANNDKFHDNIVEETVKRGKERSSEHVSSDSNNESVQNAYKSARYVDKGVYTSFQLSYAIPCDVPKTDHILRPATSTYTQTTIDSPIHRPVFMHMSSSTSTAYMSPPEMVLPDYLKHDYNIKGDKLKLTDQKDHCRNENCKSKRCKCRKIRPITKSAQKNTKTPPNTVRNNDQSSDAWDQEFKEPHVHSKKCHKFETNMKSHGHKKNSEAPLKLSSRNLVMQVTSKTSSSFKNKKSNNLQKTDLNPVIKEYVNRLLELNREGIKAIEVANQECSSVTTPGSSIVELPTNINTKKSNIQHKISLQQMKNDLKQKIIEEYAKESTCNNSVQSLCKKQNLKMTLYKLPKKKSIHKVKSLNISKRLINTKKSNVTRSFTTRCVKSNHSTTSPSSARGVPKESEPFSKKKYQRSKSSPTPRQHHNFAYPLKNKIDSHDSTSTNNETNQGKYRRSKEHNVYQYQPVSRKAREFALPFSKATTTSPESEVNILQNHKPSEVPGNISTQTSQDFDGEINLMKLAEDKLQNMEKIADLTERCTKRLSNLAKVLEEVRKNKSLAYSQISTSDTASDSEQKSDKKTNDMNRKQSLDSETDKSDNIESKCTTPPIKIDDKKDISNNTDYIPILTNIPKPAEMKCNVAQPICESQVDMRAQPLSNSNIDNMVIKNRGKPPPALNRIHLKHGQDIIPHELSTVLEVDSPMSLKLKNHSSRNMTKLEISDVSNKNNNGSKQGQQNLENLMTINTDNVVNPDILQTSNSMNVSKLPVNKKSSTDSSHDSKVQMMDLKQFNELMLKPFISIAEFAKQCNIEALDDGSNLDDNPKDDMTNDEMSSLHSDGSLPDVIAELLKRNIITEPFKFDSVSNVNSASVSSESSLSVLALSKVRKEKKKSSVVFQNKENVAETSDTLSISSNPDLENAFKKLGMGWASSTLKKTKERLALSSSSNTSSSSLSQFKLKSLNNQDIPVLVTDSVSSAINKFSRKPQQEKGTSDVSKNAGQQTSFMNSMTVKEFLTNELAKKITFTNKSNRNDTEEEFVSLFETKMPEEMKHLSQTVREERSMDSLPSANNNRARTSTPVQIFKSMTYHSSSSSNVSNGLFSNADDLSSVKVTSNSVRNHSTSDKDDLTIPNCTLKTRKGVSDCSKSE